LARANLLVAAFSCLSKSEPTHNLAKYLVDIADTVDSVSVQSALSQINGDRIVAKFPEVSHDDQVVISVNDFKHNLRDLVMKKISQYPSKELVNTFVTAAKKATQTGSNLAPSFLEDLIDIYESRIGGALASSEENVQKLLDAIGKAGAAKSGSVDMLIGKLAEVLNVVGVVAQPMQLIAKTRGGLHKKSSDLILSVRSMAICLNNENDLSKEALKITRLLINHFPHSGSLMESLLEDEETLKKNKEASESNSPQKSTSRQPPSSSEKTRQPSSQPRHSINEYVVDIGAVLKSRLVINEDAVHWRGVVVPIRDIVVMSWGGTRHSVNGIPTGTEYSILIRGRARKVFITTRRNEVYSEIIARMFALAVPNIMSEMSETWRKGGSLHFDGVEVKNHGIVLRKASFFKKEALFCPWADVRMYSANGALHIFHKDDQRVIVSLSYIQIGNVHFLEIFIQKLFDRGGLRLTDAFN